MGFSPLRCEALCAPPINTTSCAFSLLFPSSLFKFSLCQAHILKAYSTSSLWSPSLHRAPVSFSFFLLALFSFHTIIILMLGFFFFRTMGYSHLLSSDASLATFRAAYGILGDVDIAYCHHGDIEIQRHRGTNTVFFPLMSILEGGIRFLVDPLVIGTLRFYGLCPDQLPPNFFRVVSCVSKLNQLFGLQLDHHDINFMYNLCGNIESDYYLKTRDNRVRLISCLPDSNRNSAGEFVWVSGNWLAGELSCTFKPRDVGRFCAPFSFPFFFLIYNFQPI